MEDLELLLRQANSRRHIGTTSNNLDSSRGHSITMFTMRRFNSSEETASKLVLVDLAGGESPKEVPVGSQLSNEAMAINKDRDSFKTCITTMIAKGAANAQARSSKVMCLIFPY